MSYSAEESGDAMSVNGSEDEDAIELDDDELNDENRESDENSLLEPQVSPNNRE